MSQVRAWRARLPLSWVAGWALLFSMIAVAMVRFDIAQRREAFQADARMAHRLLSQRASQHEAILATLVLLGAASGSSERPEQRLVAYYPALVEVWRREADGSWPDAALMEAERRSRAAGRPEVASVNTDAGQYVLVLAGAPVAYALRIDARRVVAPDEWPFGRDAPVRAVLAFGDARILLAQGTPEDARPFGLTPGFVFEKTLDAPGQPFRLALQKRVGPAEWPWSWLGLWALLSAFAVWLANAFVQARRERARAEALLRLGRAARLGTIGGIAAGMAHELNQPLAAVLANAQAARRLLAESPPDVEPALQATGQAAAQAQRAADVVRRLRKLVETPEAAASREPVSLYATARGVLDLLAPELERRAIQARCEGRAPAVLADPVALEQIVHNLVDNAARALEAVPTSERRLALEVEARDGLGWLRVRDSGPGLPAEVRAHLFEPFVSARAGGLGLGLALSESLAQSMGGSLRAEGAGGRGAQFVLSLPLAEPAA